MDDIFDIFDMYRFGSNFRYYLCAVSEKIGQCVVRIRHVRSCLVHDSGNSENVGMWTSFLGGDYYGMYNWGSWNNHSQGYRALFAAHGLMSDQFHVTDFLTDTVRLVAQGKKISVR